MIQSKNILKGIIGALSSLKVDGLIPATKFSRASFRQLRLPLAVLVALISASTSSAYVQGNTYTTYKGEYLHSGLKKTSISIDFPSDWELKDSLTGATKGTPATIDFISPAENPADDFREKVTLAIEELHPRPPLRTYLKAPGRKFPKVPPNFRELRRGSAVIAGRRGDYAVYVGIDRRQDKKLKYKVCALIIDETETIYTLTYVADPRKYNQFLPEAEKIIKSFRLSSPQPQDPKKNWKTYQSKEFRQISFSIAYPPEWEPKELHPFGFWLISPEGYRAMITVSAQDLGEAGYDSLDKYIKRHDEDIRTHTLDYEQLQRDKCSIAGQDAYLTVYTYTDAIDPNWHLKARAYTFVVHDRFAFDLRYVGTPKEYDTFFFAAEEIINTFRLYSKSAPVSGFIQEPPVQGTFITCEQCVVLYPEKYKDDPQSCPVCGGRKEHFQPARMMVGQLVTVEAHELERRIEEFLLRAVISAHKKPVSTETLKELRELYEEKLKFHLIYGKFELDPIKAHILQLDDLIRISRVK